MMDSRSRVAERILDLTLEILSLLIGEDYIIVKKRGDPVMCRRSHYESDGPPSPVPPPHSLIPERNNEQILELTNKMMSLLTGEVPVRCDDVTVYFSMEEWEYLEGHKELYRDVMMETHQPRGSPAESACGDIFINSGDCGNEEKRDLLQTDPQNVNIESAMTSESLEDITGQSDRDAHTSQEPARRAPAHTSPAPVTREDPADTLTEPAPADCTPSRIKEEAASRDGGDDTDGEADCRAIRIMEERRWDTGVKPFSCSECGDSFTESSALARHQRSHTQKKPHSCSVCGKTFSCEFVLITHQRIHTGDKPFACSECGKLFRQSSNLIIHQRVHTGEKPYSCCECGKRFTYSVCLLKHQSGRRGEKPFSCTECGKCFTMRTCFNVHRKIHMREKSQRIHAGEKPFPCSQCGKCFKCSSELIVHQRVHTGIKPHSCSECGKRFRHRSSLVKHQRSHTGEKPYSCLECGKSFSHSSSLVKHRRDHTGEKPYSCTECGRSFSRSSSLTKHRITHTGEKPHLCSQCGKRFTQKSSLNKHRKIHVREESRL